MHAAFPAEHKITEGYTKKGGNDEKDIGDSNRNLLTTKTKTPQ